uniref:Uncharacterized protein n=1 Tax=Siphoviridae sp. ctiV651 TaxID=2827917 RepID=A0A8S5S4K2_9CAUD|nr:MAG TPA: Protein of unknown function (DUF1617) [Siphoviridae sp. ctiV651]
MTINNIINLNGRLSAIINNDNITDPALKFKLLTIMKQLEIYIKNYETVKNSLIEKYGTLDDNNVVRVDKNVDENAFNLFKEEYEKFLSTEVDVHITKVKSSEIFNAGIDSSYLLSLYEIIEE